MAKYMSPRKNCTICHGLGLEYFADSFDRDNGRPCWKCTKEAKAKKAKLILPYAR